MQSKPHKTPYLLSFLFFLNLGSFITGYLLVMYNKSTFPSELTSLDISPRCKSNFLCLFDTYVLLSSSLPLGAIFGVFLCIFLAFTLGRRKTILFSDLLAIIAAFIVMFLPFIAFSVVSRFVLGVFSGINLALIPVFSSEMLRSSGFSNDFLAFQQVSMNLGSFIGLFGLTIEVDLFIIIGICGIRFIILGFWLDYESPLGLELCKTGRIEGKRAFSYFIKDFGVIDIFLKPFGGNLGLGVLLWGLYQLNGSPLFFFYGAQIKGLERLIIMGVTFMVSIGFCMFLKRVKNYRKGLFTIGTINIVLLMLMFTNIGRDSIFGMNFIHYLMMISLQLSIGNVIWVILIGILPDIGVMLSTICYWLIGFIMSLQVNLQDSGHYYGEKGEFLAMGIIAIGIYLILWRFLKETKGILLEETINQGNNYIYKE